MHNFCNEVGRKVQCFRKWESKTENRAGLQTALLKKKKKTLNCTQWAQRNGNRKICFLKVLNDLASAHLSSLIFIFFSAHVLPSNFAYLSLLQQHWLPFSPLNMPSSFLSQDPSTVLPPSLKCSFSGPLYGRIIQISAQMPSTQRSFSQPLNLN